jgi:hypothetical protein
LGPAIVVAPLLYLDPTYCQISSTLHISLSELEQVALNFTLPPDGGRLPSAALRPSHRQRRDVCCAAISQRKRRQHHYAVIKSSMNLQLLYKQSWFFGRNLWHAYENTCALHILLQMHAHTKKSGSEATPSKPHTRPELEENVPVWHRLKAAVK